MHELDYQIWYKTVIFISIKFILKRQQQQQLQNVKIAHSIRFTTNLSAVDNSKDNKKSRMCCGWFVDVYKNEKL